MLFKCIFGMHEWNGTCECSSCGTTREEGHAWDGCLCSRCEATRDDGHNWSSGKCSKCGQTFDADRRPSNREIWNNRERTSPPLPDQHNPDRACSATSNYSNGAADSSLSICTLCGQLRRCPVAASFVAVRFTIDEHSVYHDVWRSTITHSSRQVFHIEYTFSVHCCDDCIETENGRSARYKRRVLGAVAVMAILIGAICLCWPYLPHGGKGLITGKEIGAIGGGILFAACWLLLNTLWTPAIAYKAAYREFVRLEGSVTGTGYSDGQTYVRKLAERDANGNILRGRIEVLTPDEWGKLRRDSTSLR